VPSRKALARHAMSTAARAIRTGISAARAWNKTDFGSIHAQMNAAYEARRLTYTFRLILDNERRALVERDNWLCTDC
jgi:hypothetical protein